MTFLVYSLSPTLLAIHAIPQTRAIPADSTISVTYLLLPKSLVHATRTIRVSRLPHLNAQPVCLLAHPQHRLSAAVHAHFGDARFQAAQSGVRSSALPYTHFMALALGR